MQPPAGQLYSTEILVNSPTPDEGRLIDLNDLRYSWGQTKCEALGEQFADGVDEADRPVVLEAVRRLSFVEKYHGHLI